ncbi:uncharacterized protein F5891DRAFT_1130642 [Suillus fuscotomentosus]|uniref:Uncharacterized protein n=1 Tax=Suillus fuscotomentosus TaxID=1912939 RepID=A0AAD4DWB7_9AGAM|nr:uncharacterized protein F5891DRAFT_1130642 [Suillus fuscotomentosus]KAG1895358.1 hypothetical protein F5891DRAFT_1130642 [Suillus fuscotomentosus]
MDVEDDVNQNAVAGPSTITQDYNFVFLPPPAAHPPPRTFLASTQDILGRFNLHPAYDKHVRPSIPSQMPLSHASVPPLTPGALLPDSDDKMKKNSYRFLIKSVPGKHSMKKDDYLTTMMQVPPKQRIPITEFDERTQREAFTVSAEGLKGWNVGTLVVESAQAKEDRRKRKELKKLARAQAQGLVPGGIPGAPGTLPPPQVAPSNPSQPSAQQPPAASQVQPIHSKPHAPAVTIPPPTASTRTTTPTSAAPRSAVQSSAASQRIDTSALGGMRGKKRELEDGPALPPNPSVNGASMSIGVAGVRAGSNGVRPRPVKRPRMDIQGQAREMPMQQPTPQGA